MPKPQISKTTPACMVDGCWGDGKFEFSPQEHLCESCLARLWNKVGSYFTRGGGLKIK